MGFTHPNPRRRLSLDVDSRSNGSAPYRELDGGPSGAALPVGSTRKGSLPPVVAPAIGARRRFRTARAVEIVVEQLADRPDREPRLVGENLSPVGTEKLVRTLPLPSRSPSDGPILLKLSRPVGASETSPRLGAGVVMILSDYLGLDSHYNHQHLVLTVGPKRPPELPKVR